MFKKLKKGLIVSCQAEGDDPFNSPEYISAFAKAAEMGGAVGIRGEGIEKIKAIKERVNLPVIGIIKGKFADGWTLITPDFNDVEDLIEVGCDIIAIDVTERLRPNGLNGFDFLKEVKRRYSIPIMADISTLEEGMISAELNADLIATTLSGYTPYTSFKDTMNPDFDLISEITSSVDIPVIAEGRIWSPSDAIKAVEYGAYAVVVGTAITRPRIITRMFSEALKSTQSKESLEER
jgi:N-acylglucosamine-6-phosphate 2-epimerase